MGNDLGYRQGGPSQRMASRLNHSLLAHAPKRSWLINPCQPFPTGPTHCMTFDQCYALSRLATPSSRIWTASAVCSVSATSKNEEYSVFASGLNFVLLTTTGPPVWAKTVEFEPPLDLGVRGVLGRKGRSVRSIVL